MNFSFLFFIFAFLIGLNKGSVCLTRRTDWGQLGAIFTNPVCDVWCRIRVRFGALEFGIICRVTKILLKVLKSIKFLKGFLNIIRLKYTIQNEYH